MSVDHSTPAAPLRAIVESLIEGGVRGAVICPGSRSTPMALALRAAAELECWVHLDERAGSFFALGVAKASRRPVAVLATSGTAVVNFAPAVAEARYGRVPLIVLTADRPPELQGVGAPQTIDQRELYGRHAKWFAELPIPDASAEVTLESRTLARRAIEVATGSPAGPVQLNLPFREPLLPDGQLAIEPAADRRATSDVPSTVAEPAPEDVDGVAERLARARRPIVVCGPLDDPGFGAAVSALSLSAGVPILADALSGVRSGVHDRSHTIAHHDLLSRSDSFRGQHSPDLVIRFGARPTSKHLDQWLDHLDVPQVLVDDGNAWNRPRQPALVQAQPVMFANALAGAMSGLTVATDAGWLSSWTAADAVAAEALERWFGTLEEPFEGLVPRALDEGLPGRAVLFAGNSMPVRDLDTFRPTSGREHRTLGNRGANGIDGLLSTAFGLAAGQGDPVVAVVGDLSFLHDLNALLAAARLGIDATVVLVNNDGGGIFSFLPQAAAPRPDIGLPEHYEELFGTPHGTDFGPLVAALGARYRRVDHVTLVDALRRAVLTPGIDVLELRTERARNVDLHRAAYAAVSAALEAAA